MRGLTLKYSWLMALLLWLANRTQAQEFTATNALLTKRNIGEYCTYTQNIALNHSITNRPILVSLFETEENRVFDDLGGTGMVTLSDYINQLMSQTITLQYGLVPEPKTFLTAKKDGRIFFVVEVEKVVNGRKLKNVFVVNAMNQKIVNIYESLTAVPLQLKPFELLADAPGQANTQTPTQPSATDLDWDAYQVARQANTALAYQRYLSQYPNGRFTMEAQILAEKLGQTSSQPDSPQTQSTSSYTPPATNGFSTFTETVNGVSFKMVAIKGGTFQMGSEDGDADEKPVHSVTVSDFYMGETEVTQRLWLAVTRDSIKYPDPWMGENFPVVFMSWDDIQDFIAELNRVSGKNYRLPTEAEWEYAAGGGAMSRTKWSGTDAGLGNFAWYNEDQSWETIHSVGTKSPNGLGLYDMSGNVWEWCSDLQGDYGSTSISNPVGPSTGLDRVFRGGSYRDNAFECRIANRYYTPAYRNYAIGFRLVLSTN